jgi:hypothetical protein
VSARRRTLPEIELHRDPKMYRGRDVRWPPSEIREEPLSSEISIGAETI